MTRAPARGFLALAALGAAACQDPAATDGTTTEPSTRRDGVVTATTYEAESDREGYVTVEVEVPENVASMQIVVKRSRGMLSTDYLYGPGDELVLDWEDWYDSSFSLTECFFPTEYATTLNWPVRAQDGPLEAGTWKVDVATLDAQYNYAGGQAVEVEVLTRPDRSFDEGTLHVVVAYAEGVRDEPGVVDAVEEAVTYWGELYAASGVTLDATYDDIAVDADLPDTYEGLEEIAAYHEQLDGRAILMVVGEQIANDRWLYGEAGGIPGPYTSAEHAAVFVSWLANAGADAEFGEADVLLMGETMAHEVGHYLGLFHPVEDGWEYWDALDDTDDCGGTGSCEAALGSNLMFPYPVCTGGSATSCERQDQVTSGQAGIIQRYVGVE